VNAKSRPEAAPDIARCDATTPPTVPETCDSAGRPWSVFLDPLRVTRLVSPYEDSDPVRPGYWAETAAMRRQMRREEAAAREALRRAPAPRFEETGARR